MKPIHYISVPLWQGAERKGVDMASAAFMEAGIDAVIRRYNPVEFLSLPPIAETITPENKYAVIADYIRRIKQTVSDCLATDTFPFTVGGDHTLGLGTAAAAAERFDNLGLIWFDAHGDMNTETTSQTGHIHGMPVAALMGLCSSELNEVATRRIKPENIFWIGTRSLDAGERALIEQLHLHVYSAEYVRSVGMKQVMEEVQAELQSRHIRHLHCSIDVDALDPAIVAGTGVPEPNGLNTGEYDLFVEKLAQLPVELTSMDFVEYNPLLDDEDKHTRTWCLQAIEKLMKAISQ